MYMCMHVCLYTCLCVGTSPGLMCRFVLRLGRLLQASFRATPNGAPRVRLTNEQNNQKCNMYTCLVTALFEVVTLMRKQTK